MPAHRAPTPDELLAALDGAPLASDVDDGLLRLGRALPAAVPPAPAPAADFASRLRTKLTAAPPPAAAAPFLKLSVLLPLVGVVAVATIVFFLPRAPQQPGTPNAGTLADTAVGPTNVVPPEAAVPLAQETALAPAAGQPAFTAPATTPGHAPTTTPTSTPPTPPPATEATSTPPAKPMITLSGAAKTDAAFLTWTISDLPLDGSDGFAVAWSAKGDPTFPADQKLVVGTGERAATAKGLAAGTPYAFRVCLLRDKTCETFSSVLVLTTEPSLQQP